MPHFVDELQDEARRAIAGMREAAINARRVHARAELMRHMRLTAAKVRAEPREEAVTRVVAEWSAAWRLDAMAWPDLAAEMRAFTHAFCEDAEQGDGASQARLRTAAASLEAAFDASGRNLSDEMALRSECAHAWWFLVSPRPADLDGAQPTPAGGPASRPFWELGCPAHCLG